MPSDLIVLNDKETAIQNQQREPLDLTEGGKIGWEKVCELGEVLIGKLPGRSTEQQLIYYKSNTGAGIQVAAAGAVAHAVPPTPTPAIKTSLAFCRSSSARYRVLAPAAQM